MAEPIEEEPIEHLASGWRGRLSWRLREAPRRIFGRWIKRLPLDFRVLYKQFLLRILDLEALSIETDMVEYLSQFAGILIFISGMQGLGILILRVLHPAPFTPLELYVMSWQAQHGIVEKTLLVAGLTVVFLWDTPFPDRRDLMILGPLPIRPTTLLAAKLASPAAVLALATLCLNWATILMWPTVLEGGLRLILSCALTAALIATFLFALLLAIEGLGALLLPRQLFLRLSALSQLAAFALFPIGYFLLGQTDSPTAILAPENHAIAACWPGYWFLALLRQLSGELPPAMNWLAWRAWAAIAIAIISASAALLTGYPRTLRRIAEEPDLEPSRSSRTWQIPFGNRLQTVLVYFSLRTLIRSRQHRIALAFLWALVLCMALGMTHDWLQANGPRPVDENFLISTLIMMAVATGGMRGIFSLPIAHKANWMLRVTQLQPTHRYLIASRRILLLLAVLPVWFIAFFFSLSYRPWPTAAEHLFLLAITGLLSIEISLIHFAKLPFTCSFLPGKANMQYLFWGFILIVALIVAFVTSCEEPALTSMPGSSILAALTIATTLALSHWNRTQEQTAELYFEEKPEPPIITLGLVVNPRLRIQPRAD